MGPTGSGRPISIVKPFLVMNYIISLLGVFPSQNEGGFAEYFTWHPQLIIDRLLCITE
jgi:hypothetical protein